MRVALFKERAYAVPIQQRLIEAGIPAEIHDELGKEALWFVSKPEAGARLEVPSDQFERAEDLLLEWDASGDVLRNAVRCPECRSLRVEYPQFTPRSMLTNLAMGVAAETGLVEKTYYCEDCHCTWPKENAKPPRPREHMAPNYFIEDIESARGKGT